MKIEVFHFDECPNHGPTVERVKEALRQEGLTAELVEVNVRDEATAQSVRFLGSPTVQIDGMDVEATARLSKDFGMMCRTYGDSGKRVGIPPIDLIRAALRETAGGEPGAPDATQFRQVRRWDRSHTANRVGHFLRVPARREFPIHPELGAPALWPDSSR